MRKRLQSLIFAALAAVGVTMAGGPAKASVVVDPTVGGNFIFVWEEKFDGGGLSDGGLGPIDRIQVPGGYDYSGIWEMEVAKDSILSVATATDCCIAGDQFELVFDGAATAWDTATQLYGVVIPEFDVIGAPPLDGNYQFSIFDLFMSAGTHTFTLNVLTSVAEPGVGLMSFGPAVIVHNPLPAALPLFGTGLVVFGYLGWRRRGKATATA